MGVKVVHASGWQGLSYLATSMLEVEGAVVVDLLAQDKQDGLCKVSYQQENSVVDWIVSKWGCKREKSEVDDVVVTLKEKWGERYQREM